MIHAEYWTLSYRSQGTQREAQVSPPELSKKYSAGNTRMSRILTVGAVLIFFGFVANDGAAHDSGVRAAALRSAACAAPNYRQFDFWIGRLGVFDVDNLAIKVARVRVESMLNRCVLHETCEGTDGHQGQSFSIFDVSRQVWHQSWVTNDGQLLVVEGGMQAAAMILNGADRTANGKKRRVRGIWKPVNDGVRESATRSTDGGVTWQSWFDLLFRPHQDEDHVAAGPGSRANSPATTS